MKNNYIQLKLYFRLWMNNINCTEILTKEGAPLLGLQVYTGKAENNRTLFKLHGINDQVILEYVEELKKCGYEVISFPPIEKFRNYYITNIVVDPPIETA
jgi:hypothetical protein